MKLVIKLVRAVIGLVLTLFYTRIFRLSYLKNKRIALVGPASSATDTNKGDFIDSFDVVIRVNKAWLLVQDGHSSKDIGSKTDILFHCYFENEYSGGGELNFSAYDKLGIKFVVNPRSTKDGFRVIFNFYKKYLSTRITHVLPRSFYAKLQRDFGKYRPTTGYAALYSILESDFKEFYLTGFTFFKTGYAPGYRDDMKEKQQVQKYIKRMNIHDSDFEYEHFKKVLYKHRKKNILLDEELEAILTADSQFEFSD